MISESKDTIQNQAERLGTRLEVKFKTFQGLANELFDNKNFKFDFQPYYKFGVIKFDTS